MKWKIGDQEIEPTLLILWVLFLISFLLSKWDPTIIGISILIAGSWISNAISNKD